MKRRKFIKKAGLATAATIGMPYLLPSGRLFASTGGVRMADHVVFVLFAGGVRHQESIGQRYLADSQDAYNVDDLNIEGNIMFNILEGEAPEKKITYGKDLDGQTPGSLPIQRILSTTLEKQGTLFSEMTCGTASHYLGLSALVSGNYGATQGLRQKPVFPTIFEYTRKCLGLSPTDVWFLGNGINNSTPLLNYSEYEGFGAEYGANFFAPNLTFGAKGKNHLANAKSYHPEEELGPVYEMKTFLDNAYLTSAGELPGIENSEEEKYRIKQFMDQIFERAKGNGEPLAMPPTADNGDLRTVGYTCEILREFKPTLTVCNLSGVDACHSNFTGYLRNLHRADHAVGHLWNVIQQTPGMANNTVLIAAPEHGRNLQPNNILDSNSFIAYDHSDANARRNFTLMAGPGIDAGLRLGSEGNPIGDTAQCLMTIAEVLGFKQDVQNAGLTFSNQSLFDLI